MKRVKVDFSTTVKGGMIRANQQRASETLYEGDEVEAFDPAEDMAFVGVVDHLSDDGRFAFLRMEWEDAGPVPHNEPGCTLFVAFESGRAVAQAQLPTTGEKGEGGYVSPLQVAPPLVQSLVPQSA